MGAAVRVTSVAANEEDRAAALDKVAAQSFVARVSKRRVKAKRTERELRGSPIAVAEELLGEHPQAGALLEIMRQLVARNAELERKLAAFRSRTGNAREKVSSDQLDLFFDLLRTTAADDLKASSEALRAVAAAHGGRPAPQPPPKQPAVRRPPPPTARRVDNPISVPAAERPCPTCGGPRRCLTHEVTEVIDLIPAEVIVRVDRREVLTCDHCDGEMERAPMGDKVVPGGYYGSGLVAQLLVDKYRDGLPLHRIGQRLSGLGLDIPSASLSDQVLWGAELLQPLQRAAIMLVLTADIMHLDGTSIPVRDKDTGHQVQLGALWAYVGVTGGGAGPPLAAYLFNTTGKKVGVLPGELGPEQVLALRRGPVVADASNLFDKSFQRDDLIEVGCNMHARRYFVKALDAGDARAAPAIAAYRTLYDVEDGLQGATLEQILTERETRSRPVYDELLAWMRQLEPLETPASKLGEALRYLKNHQIALTRFLDDPTLPIDNGIVERLHRRPAIVRRNMLFAGSYDGARRAAIVFTILACCELADVEPVAYLRDVLPRIARSGGLKHADACALLPAAWKAARVAPSP